MSAEPIFNEREDGLVEYCGPTDLPLVIEIWRKIDTGIDEHFWSQASVAASVVTVYGQDQIGQLAEAIEKSSGHLRRMARTYRHYSENEPRGPLSFKHHSISLRHPEPGHALLMAVENNWSCVKLEEWILNEAVENTKVRKANKLQRQNDYREFLERVDSIILTDFMATCPNADWGRRVFKNWRDEVAWELRQVGHDENAEYVAAALEEGATTVADIKSATGLAVKDIEGVIGIKVAEGVWEWVREGGETDMARGSRRAILHVVGRPVFQ